MTRSLVPTWICSICREHRMLDIEAEQCERCDRVVCPDCWDRDFSRCDACADRHYLSEEALLSVIFEWPGMVQSDLAERARTAALLARFNQRDLSRFVPRPDWYLARVRALLAEMHAEEYVVCNHRHQRQTDHGPLCEYRLTQSGLEELRAMKGAA